MDSLNRVAVVFALAAAAAWAMVAYSIAATTELPSETPSQQIVPEAKGPGASGSSSGPLSDKLDRSHGVIHPPFGVDPNLPQPPPATGPGSMPVIPPPGTPGGESGVNPK